MMFLQMISMQYKMLRRDHRQVMEEDVKLDPRNLKELDIDKLNTKDLGKRTKINFQWTTSKM
jgi:hypothetical protein